MAEVGNRTYRHTPISLHLRNLRRRERRRRNLIILALVLGVVTVEMMAGVGLVLSFAYFPHKNLVFGSIVGCLLGVILGLPVAVLLGWKFDICGTYPQVEGPITPVGNVWVRRMDSGGDPEGDNRTSLCAANPISDFVYNGRDREKTPVTMKISNIELAEQFQTFAKGRAPVSDINFEETRV